jgi:hypothetical protein
MKCNITNNLKNCNCSYDGCEKKGKCCLCINHHLKKKQLPACFFPSDIEKTYDRSFKKFAELINNNKL